MLSEPIQVTLKVTNAFEQLGIPYLIGGSFASAIHGIVRATMDADLVADIQLTQVSSLIALLEKEFYINAEMIREAIQRTSSFNLIHLETRACFGYGPSERLFLCLFSKFCFPPEKLLL